MKWRIGEFIEFECNRKKGSEERFKSASSESYALTNTEEQGLENQYCSEVTRNNTNDK